MNINIVGEILKIEKSLLKKVDDLHYKGSVDVQKNQEIRDEIISLTNQAILKRLELEEDKRWKQ